MPLSRPGGADDWEVGLRRARSCHGVGGEVASWLPARRNQNPQQDLPQGGADLGHVGITPRPRPSCQLPFWTLRREEEGGLGPGSRETPGSRGRMPGCREGSRARPEGSGAKERDRPSPSSAPAVPCPVTAASPGLCRGRPRAVLTPATGTALRPPAGVRSPGPPRGPLSMVNSCRTRKCGRLEASPAN